MGRVWRATDVVLHREVAIKELVPPPGLTPGERQEMRERSLREARAIARLNNINVVRVFDVLSTDADPWIVMEYVPSRSLQDILAADGPFSPVRTAEMGLGVLGALRAAHRAGVVHRDVKPGNVLIGADGRVVLTDFGLATVPGDPNVTRTGLVLGSPAYIAPERARDGTAGPAADLWSLGATLYAAVEGASPFARPSAIATLAALATENPPPARNAGPLKPVLNGLLRKDPTHRINAEEAERLLNRALGRRSKLSFPMSPTMRRPGVGRERPALTSPTNATPVVPGPRPPVAPARPVDPPGRPAVSGGRPAAGEGRPPVYVPGKAPVGRPDTPTKVDGQKVDAPRLDATRLDTPPVKDDKTTFMGTRGGSTTAGSPPPAARQTSPANSPTHTNRGERAGFTAADVAANRRRKSTPDPEQPPADATALVRSPAAPPADKTTVVAPPADRTTVVPPPADKTTVVAPPADKTTVVAPPTDKTTVVAAPEQADATTMVPPAKPTPKKKSTARPTPKPTPAAAEKTEAEAPEPATADAAAAVAGSTETTDEPADTEVPTERAEPAESADAPAKQAEAATEQTEKAGQDEPVAATEEKAPAKLTVPQARTEAKPIKSPAEPANDTATKAAKAAPNTTGEKPADEDNAPVSPIPVINRSSRPAWRPMEPRPVPGGVTVFGTRLTYRQAAIGAGLILLVLALVITLVAQSFGSDSDKTGGAGPTGAATVPTTQAAQPTQPTTAATTPSAAPSSAAPTTTAPSSAAASTPANSAALPKGWTYRTIPATGSAPGFKIPLPSGVNVSGGGTEMRFTYNNRLLILGRTKSPQADAYDDWKSQEKARRGTYRDYNLIRLDRATYRDYESVADWEYTYTTDKGNPQHVIRRNIRVDSSAAFSLNWYVSTSDWAASQADLQAIYQGFQPL
ncbi:hypothetical protein Adu01nite_08150 [Paractinoplanes durhamensis]|uniref:Protein kinase domain-containing protein n=1 Tax=Paractinoplanes durhamensis TaxID=113563 RepID=A0ABQ3YPE6_9ACTN|nr:hypothetical protein Adu01nite_08150 [Actinoplanes durhamensis]